MATAYYTPGVYIEEVDRGTKPIQGVATSVTAFIGFTSKAEKVKPDGITTESILGTPTLITNWGQYEQLFGSFHEDAYLPYAVRGFFDNGGTRCYVVSVRVMEEHTAQAIVNGHDTGRNRPTPVLLLRAAQGGITGNDLSVSFTAIKDEDVTKLSDKQRRQKRYMLHINGAASPAPSAADAAGDGREIKEAQEKVDAAKATVDQLSQEIDAMKQEWKKKDVDLDATQAALKKLDESRAGENISEVKKEYDNKKSVLGQAEKELGAAEDALKRASAQRPISAPSDTGSVQTLEFCLDDLPVWGEARLEEMKWKQWQRQREGERQEPSVADYIGQRLQKLPVEVWKLNKQGREAAILPDVEQDYRLGDGTMQFDYDFLVKKDPKDGIQPGASADEQAQVFINNSALLYQGGQTERKGVDGLYAVDEVNLVCAPDLMKAYEVLGEKGRSEADSIVKSVQGAILTFCQKAHYPFAILDAPPTVNKDVQAMADWRMGLPGGDTMHGALYYPWITITDPLDAKRQIEIPPCGHIAGIYARSDTQRGVHKAPANEIVNGAVDLPIKVTHSEQELLNPIGVNCIRQFPGRGIRVWGARTLSMTDPAWRYINVRRLFSYVEASVEQSTQWVVFEPNDYALWSKVTRDVTAFLRTVWLSGALFGRTPEEAFYVKCDESTNLPELRDLGQMVCEIGLAPVKPAEFVIFRFSQWTAEADTGG